eukprot:TRINITY_DN17156_c0_g1_i1.p1 TRINITY_DN17156_c0_g1~~TRINITY_DN17156_c0_g1_i1.p1  ORF type:complete len:382 (+),score=127.74 TRINITY_DN17156_c0_g1_i1:60-1148(+)
MSHAKNNPFHDELIATANAIVADGKGILAADESSGTIGKRFAGINVENNHENRIAYRELLFRNGDEWNKWIGGVILYEETLFDKAPDGTPLVDLITAKGVIPGIKVDMGSTMLPGSGAETDTHGLDGLAVRAKKYYDAGARFAKWRAILRINKEEGHPSVLATECNAHGLARYAAICQANGLVPIVEPEVLMDGKHTIEEAAEATERVLSVVYRAMNEHHVLLEGTLLKPNMVYNGTESGIKNTPDQVAKYTLQTLRRTVPPAVAGITFLSGGQSEEDATLNLNAMNASDGRKPWKISFSFGRALQASALKAWQGKAENVKAAQDELSKRAAANQQAASGTYTGGAAGAAAADSLHVKDYTY